MVEEGLCGIIPLGAADIGRGVDVFPDNVLGDAPTPGCCCCCCMPPGGGFGILEEAAAEAAMPGRLESTAVLGIAEVD